MSDRIQKLCALILVLIGVACMIYALASWNQLETAEEQGMPRPHPTPPEDEPKPAPSEVGREPAPAEPAPRVEGGDEEPAVPESRDDPSTVDPNARRRAVQLWLIAALPLVFLSMIVIILLQRWLRPKPMQRTGPTDTTDLWVEAGKRLRIE